MSETVVSVEGFAKEYRTPFRRRRVQAVKGASFSVARGEIFGFVGPNGAGKTTTIRALMGLIRPTAGRLAMMVRSSMIDELNKQYVKTAKAKGMSYGRIVGLHALRNGSIPAITLTGWELIRMLAGYTVVVEVVFNWPGLGQTAIQAVQRQDLFLLQTIVLVVAAMVVVINIAVDILYKAIDPRVQLS